MKVSELPEHWREIARTSEAEATRIDYTIHAITDASSRCRLSAEIRRVCAVQLDAAITETMHDWSRVAVEVVEVAKRLGITRGDTPLTGSDVLLLLQHIEEMARRPPSTLRATLAGAIGCLQLSAENPHVMRALIPRLQEALDDDRTV